MEHRYSVSCVLALVLALAPACSRSAPPKANEPLKESAQPAASDAPACDLISQSEVAAAVGNPVLKGVQDGTSTCKWDTEKKEETSALLIISRKGSTREPYLCDGLRKQGGNEQVEGLDVATWKFSNAMRFFNSGDFEGCGPKGFVSLSLNGQPGEPELKKATLAIVRQVVQRM